MRHRMQAFAELRALVSGKHFADQAIKLVVNVETKSSDCHLKFDLVVQFRVMPQAIHPSVDKLVCDRVRQRCRQVRMKAESGIDEWLAGQ